MVPVKKYTNDNLFKNLYIGKTFCKIADLVWLSLDTVQSSNLIMNFITYRQKMVLNLKEKSIND